MEKDSRNEWEIPAREEDLEMISAMKEITLRFGKKDDYRTREAYKTLRTNIEFSGSDIKTIAITSCTPNEGKSSVAMELAKAFAEAGKKTILVDADLRKSVLVGRYKTGAVKHGLTHALIGRESLEKVGCRQTFRRNEISGNDTETEGTVRLCDRGYAAARKCDRRRSGGKKLQWHDPCH